LKLSITEEVKYKNVLLVHLIDMHVGIFNVYCQVLMFAGNI